MSDTNKPGTEGTDGDRGSDAVEDVGRDPLDLSSNRLDRTWQPVTVVYGGYGCFMEDVLWHVGRSLGPALPHTMKDFDEWETTKSWAVANHLSRQVSYAEWAILGVTPTRMAFFVRMICAELL